MIVDDAEGDARAVGFSHRILSRVLRIAEQWPLRYSCAADGCDCPIETTWSSSMSECSVSSFSGSMMDRFSGPWNPGTLVCHIEVILAPF